MCTYFFLIPFAEAQPPPLRGTKRKNFPQAAVKILVQWYNANILCPYPTDADVETLSRECGITEEQVIKWMYNKRQRCRNTLNTNGCIHPTKRRKVRHEQEMRNNPEAAIKYKKRRAFLPPRAVQILEKFYNEHTVFPFPTETEKRMLAERANITVKQVSTWFSNTRNRRRNTRPRKKKERRPGIQSDTVVSVTETMKEMNIDNHSYSDTESDTGTITYSHDETSL